MAGARTAEKFTNDFYRSSRCDVELDYCRIFADLNRPVAPINDQPLDRYQVTLEGIRKIDPETYRMVLFSWA
jgi:hypothetical protein